MICYRDMTFCSFSKDCLDKQCHRALTPEVKRKAQEIGLLICMFVDKPACFKEKK